MSDPAVRTRGLGRLFAVSPLRTRRALSGVDLEISPGEAVALVGPSGAGKSTFLRLLVGAIAPTEGDVRVFGVPPAEAARARRLGYLPDDLGIPPGLTGREVARLHAGLARARPAEAEARLDRLGLRAALDLPAASYSLGMRARLAIAAAMAGPPDLLLLDEPFTGLDPALRRAVREELKAFVAAGGTLLASSHLLVDLQGLVSRVVAIFEGRLRDDVPAAAVFAGDPEAWYLDRAAAAGSGA